MPNNHPWVDELPCAVTVCDVEGTIISMNSASVATFQNDGGAALVGSNVLDCHPEPSRTQLDELLKNAGTNIYTIEKAGRKKIICQLPWFSDGVFSGLVEMSIVLPVHMPHFKRD